MRKLIIQIPCFNEAETLPRTLADLPRAVTGFEIVEWLIIDDGSTDQTTHVARKCGVDHVVTFNQNRGLARAFMAGLEASLKAGADVIVNTDADNQYVAADIPKLVAPILDGQAQVVVGARPIESIREFSLLKKLLQRIGSSVVRLASGTRIADAPSGFRAIHKDAAIRFNVFGNYTYTLETIIQAGRNDIPIMSVPIRVNPTTRPSRLVRNIPSYVYRSVINLARIFVLYKPLRFFAFIGTLFLLPGVLLGLRFIYHYATEDGGGRVQSLILAAILILVAGIIYAAAVLSDLIAANRVMLEDLRIRALRREIGAARASALSQDKTR